MTHMSGRCNRLLVATGALVALATSHPASAQGVDHSRIREAIRSISFTNAPAVPSRISEVRAAAADEASADAKRASIVGTVHGPSDAVVAGAGLTIKNVATDEVLRDTSDASGA